MLETRYTENHGVTSKFEYEYEGTSVFDATPVYSERETKFSIKRGVIEDHEFVRYVDSNGETYKSFYIR